MIIALDIMGGDYAPREAMHGVRLFFEENANPDIRLALVGDKIAMQEYESLLEPYQWRYTFVASEGVIGMNEHPTKALKEKPNSSIGMGYQLMAAGKADAFISAGNTGAMMVGAMYALKTIEGILRPTIVSLIPREDGAYNLVLDVGANADCKPEHLVQFAELGSLYSRLVLGVKEPTVGLLNIGEEEGKGNILTQTTYPLLKDNPHIRFVGNVEGRDILTNKADVIVCEGFVGNVALKMAESIYDIFLRRNVTDSFLDQFNFQIYGGTPIIGLNGPVVIGHGISEALAFRNMIEVASKIVTSDLVPALKSFYAAQ